MVTVIGLASVRRVLFLIALLVFFADASVLVGQVSAGWLSNAIAVDSIAGETRTHLERVRAFLKDSQWDEAIETLCQLMEDEGDKLVAVSDLTGIENHGYPRYVSLREFGHSWLAAMATTHPQALQIYRQRVDSLAERWFRDGVKHQDERRLQKIIDHAVMSRYGDDALLALGEMVLEKGDFVTARRCWERLSPTLRSPNGLPLGWEVDLADARQRWKEVSAWLNRRPHSVHGFAYPDTDLDLKIVRARLVLVSILEGSFGRAEIELELLQQLFPQARGILAGREGRLVEILTDILRESRTWKLSSATGDWPTLAGSPQRNSRALRQVDVVPHPVWSLTLHNHPSKASQYRPTWKQHVLKQPLSFYPIVSGNMLLIQDAHYCRALNRFTGEPAFPSEQNTLKDKKFGAIDGRQQEAAESGKRTHPPLGVPRYTATVFNDYLFTRSGSPLTTVRSEATPLDRRSQLDAWDLRRDGSRLAGFPIQPDGNSWEFEGAPISNGRQLFVIMRRRDVRPQAHVACFDLPIGRLVWRRLICSAETENGSQTDEITSSLLTMDHDTVYCNTNLGAVCAIDAPTGNLRWVTHYPRTRRASLGSSEVIGGRDLNPGILHGGMLLVHPSDAESLFALEAATGKIIWENRLFTETPHEPSHLLGVGVAGNLIASGNRLWWIDVGSGKVLAVFPPLQSLEPGNAKMQPRGYGRGLLVDRVIYWPTRQEIFVFDQAIQLGKPAGGPQRYPSIFLRDPSNNTSLTGGNLLLAGEYLYIATSEALYAFNESGRVVPPLAAHNVSSTNDP